MNTVETWTCWREPTHEVEPHPLFGWPHCVECGAAPQYWERKPTPGLMLNLYTPTGRLAAVIRPGSGVAGLPVGERVLVYYEGWVNGAMQYEGLAAHDKWAAGVLHAADRMVTQYPTIAQAVVLPDELRLIGTYNAEIRQPYVLDEAALQEWLDAREDWS